MVAFASGRGAPKCCFPWQGAEHGRRGQRDWEISFERRADTEYAMHEEDAAVPGGDRIDGQDRP